MAHIVVVGAGLGRLPTVYKLRSLLPYGRHITLIVEWLPGKVTAINPKHQQILMGDAFIDYDNEIVIKPCYDELNNCKQPIMVIVA